MRDDEIVTPVQPDGSYSLMPGEAYGPDEAISSYTADPPRSMYSPIVSGAQRQPNGNTLICEGATGELREVQPPHNGIVWLYQNPLTSLGPVEQGTNHSATTFRAERYAPGFPGFIGRDLTPGRLLELYPGDANGDSVAAFDDILAIIGQWGPCPGGGDPCWADLSGNGVVDFADVLEVIGFWGPYCP